MVIRPVLPPPDEEYWGLHIWKRGRRELIADPNHDQFTVMVGAHVEKVMTSREEAAAWLAERPVP